MGVLNLGMSIMGIDQNIQKVVKGMVLLAAVIFDVVSKRKIFYRKIIIVSESGQQVFGVIRNLLFLGVYTVVLCEVILSVFVVLWGMCLFLGERYIIIRASDRKYEIMLSGGCNGKYSNDLFCK